MNQDQTKINEENQLLIDQFKRKRVKYERELVDELNKLANFYSSYYEDIDEISEETIAGLFLEDGDKYSEEEKESYKILNKILEYQHGIEKVDYILNRNRYEDGKLDYTLSISELTKTREKAKNVVVKMGIEKIRQTSTCIRSMYKGLSEQNADFKIRYEIQKEFMCNKYGYTPESFDEYFEALRKSNLVTYDKNGSNVIKGAYVHSNDLNEKFKYLLKKKENWDGEEVVYKSEFLTRYKEHYEKMEKERPKNTEYAKLYQEFLNMNRDLVLKFKGFDKDGKVKGDSRMGEEISESSRKSLREQRLARRKKREESKKETVVEEDKPKVANIDYTTLVEDTKEEIKQEIKEEIPKDAIKEDTKEIIVDEVIEEHNVDNKENEEEITPVEVIEHIEEEEEEIVEEPKYDFEKVLTKVEQAADISILRSNNPDKLRKYNESYKYGRILYLPYSGYEILVKRIVDRSQLSYILELLQSNKLATDLTVELEIIRVIYANIEFFLEETPSELDFYRNLSIRDIPLIICTMALISQKENEKGEVLVDVDRVICLNENCQKKIMLEKPIVLDIKREFSKIYPIEIYYSNYHLMREKNYKNIYQAFVNSIDGKLEKMEYEDETLRYQCFYGNVTFYNTCESMNKKIDELIYQLFKDDISKMSDSDLETEFPLLDVKDFIEGKYLVQLQLRYNEILTSNPDIEKESKIEDKERTDEELDIIDEYKHLKAIFDKLDGNLDEMSNMLSVMTNIRSLKIYIKETDELVVDTNTDDLYTLFNTVTSLPQGFYKKILDQYIKYRKEMSEVDYKRTLIKVNSKLLKSKIKITSVLKPREEFLEHINKKYNSEDIRKQWIETYDMSVENLSNGLCTCGHDEFYINYYNLLFFSIIKQMGVKTSLD